MAQSYSFSVREDVIRLHEAGHSMVSISLELGIHYNTVRSLVKRYKLQGRDGMYPRYDRCGRTRRPSSELSYRLVRWYKHHHPGWGVAYILMHIREKHPDLAMCVSRVYERRLRADNLLSVPRNPPLLNKYHPPTSVLPHDTWQVDAKEQIVTVDGKPACYLTFTDEKTGSVLAAHVFPL